jgi:hypothetical protein
MDDELASRARTGEASAFDALIQPMAAGRRRPGSQPCPMKPGGETAVFELR